MQKELETQQDGKRPARRPLSALSKVSLAGLITSGVLIFPFGFFAWSVFGVRPRRGKR